MIQKDPSPLSWRTKQQKQTLAGSLPATAYFPGVKQCQIKIIYIEALRNGFLKKKKRGSDELGSNSFSSSRMAQTLAFDACSCVVEASALDLHAEPGEMVLGETC